jgi:hypothetical protein
VISTTLCGPKEPVDRVGDRSPWKSGLAGPDIFWHAPFGSFQPTPASPPLVSKGLNFGSCAGCASPNSLTHGAFAAAVQAEMLKARALKKVRSVLKAGDRTEEAC